LENIDKQIKDKWIFLSDRPVSFGKHPVIISSLWGTLPFRLCSANGTIQNENTFSIFFVFLPIIPCFDGTGTKSFKKLQDNPNIRASTF
jgi:hypothetical protein